MLDPHAQAQYGFLVREHLLVVVMRKPLAPQDEGDVGHAGEAALPAEAHHAEDGDLLRGGRVRRPRQPQGQHVAEPEQDEPGGAHGVPLGPADEGHRAQKEEKTRQVNNYNSETVLIHYNQITNPNITANEGKPNAFALNLLWNCHFGLNVITFG